MGKGNLIYVMEDMGFEADICRWAESFIAGRGVKYEPDGRMGAAMDVETGVLQGSPVSPILLKYILQAFSMSRIKGRYWILQHYPL
jgi:hypothetical protein